MKFFKILMWLVFLVIALVIGAAIFFAATFDANQYKNQITTLVNKQTGRELDIKGDLSLGFYPDIAIKLGQTSLSNAAGFSGDHFATVGSAEVSVAFTPLLKKQLKIDEVRLNQLNLNLQRKADGSANWDDLANGETSKKDSKQEPSAVVKEMLGNLSIAGVSLKEATINWQDAQTGQNLSFSPVNLETGAFKPGKPLPVTLDLVMQQQKPAMKISADAKTTVTLGENQDFTLADLILNAKLTGQPVPNGAVTTSVKGNISGSAQKISAPNLQATANVTGDLIPQGSIDAELGGKLDLDLNARQVTVGGMKLNSTVSGKPLAGGQLQALVSGDSKFNLDTQVLNIPNLKLDSNLEGGHIKDGAASSKLSGNLTLDLAKSQVSIPQLSMTNTVKGGIVPGGALNQQGQGAVNLNWASKQGSVNLDSLLVQLADLQLTGKQVKIQPLAAKPAISGQFFTNTFNLKQALKTLGIAPPTTSNPEAMTQAQAQFSLDADSESANLQQLKIKLDKTNINGSLGVSNFTQPAIRPKLSIDSINVDDYLAPAGGDKTTPASKSASSKGAELLPLDTLRTLAIDGDAKIGSMVVNKLKLNNISTRIKADKGLITIDPANASLYKGDYAGRITLDARQATPTMKMHHELVGLRSEGLLFDLFADKYISGDARLVTDLTSRGNTIDALIKNLNGTSSLNFKDGTIRDSKLAQKVSLAVKAFEKKEVEDGESVVKFTGLSGDMKTTDGVFSTNNLNLTAPYFKILGEGSADLVKETLDLQLRIGPNKKGEDRNVFAPLRIHGPFTNLKFSLNLEDLLKALAKEDLEKAKLKAQQKLEAEKEKLQQRLQAEKAAKLKELQQKADETKAKALKKLQDKAGDKLGDALKQQLGGEKEGQNGSVKTPEKLKDLEDNVKDKLKEGLRGLF